MGIQLRTGRTKEIGTPEARSVAGLVDGGSGQGRKDTGEVAKSTAHCEAKMGVSIILAYGEGCLWSSYLLEQYLVTQASYGHLILHNSQCFAVHIAHRMPAQRHANDKVQKRAEYVLCYSSQTSLMR